MRWPLAALVVAACLASTAGAEPAWVAANHCVAEPAIEPACGSDPVLGASRHDLEQCACDLLASAGLTGCDDLRMTEGRQLVIDRKLASAIQSATVIYRQPTLLAAVGAIAAMRTASLPQRELTEIAAATGACRRLIAGSKNARQDLVCSLGRAEASSLAPPIAPRWPWCSGCSKNPTSRAIAFAMPSTNVRYPALFDIAANQLDRTHDATQWACVTTRERSPDLQFGNAPIALDMTKALAAFATAASLAASPYVVDEIEIGACTDVRLKTGPETRALRTGHKLTLANVRKHARGTSCDLERVTFRHPDGKRIDVPLRAKSFREALVPFVERAFEMRWSELRTYALQSGARHLYEELAVKVRTQPLDAMVLGVLTRRALVDAGLVVYDPLVNAGHDKLFHVETSADAVPRPTVIDETTAVADLNRTIQAIDRKPITRERALVRIQGTSSDPFEDLVTRQAQKWCAAEREATITFDFVHPAPATRLHAWSDAGDVTVTGDDKPWRVMTKRDGYVGFAAPQSPVRSLTVRVRSPQRACVHFVLEGRHIGDVGEAHDLVVERVTRTEDLTSLDPFIAELDRAIGSCSLTALSQLVHLPLAVEYRRWGKTVTRSYKSPRELAHACHLEALPRPTRAIEVATDGVTASQQFKDRKNRAWWSYRVDQGHWRLTSARLEHVDQ